MLSGVYGMNLWSSFRTPAPQRSARLYRRLVREGLASAVNGSLLPTELPFVYILSVTATDGTPLEAVESALLAELDGVVAQGITPAELTKAKAQLKARLVFDNDSVTNIAHQLGDFETIASVDVFRELVPRIAAVTLDEVSGNRARGLQCVEPYRRLVRSIAGRLIPMSPGLAPARSVLANGAVLLAKRTQSTPSVTINIAVRAGSICRSSRRHRRHSPAFEGHRPRDPDAIGR